MSQDIQGNITGQFHNGGAGQCPAGEIYSLSGNYNGSGHFTLSGAYKGQNVNCAQGFTDTGTISGSACTVASVSYSNSSNVSGTEAWKGDCNIPDGETTPGFYAWVNDAMAQFYQMPQLVAVFFDFGGRTIAETFPQMGDDTCHFFGSAIPDQSAGTAAPPFVVDSPGTYRDTVGPNGDFVTYYRETGKTPCSITNHQVMVIACPTKNMPFQSNDLITSIGDSTVKVKRGPTERSETWGPLPPKYVITVILNRLLLGRLHR